MVFGIIISASRTTTTTTTSTSSSTSTPSTIGKSILRYIMGLSYMVNIHPRVDIQWVIKLVSTFILPQKLSSIGAFNGLEAGYNNTKSRKDGNNDRRNKKSYSS